MALNGYTISGDVYAWTAVFILPVNSALNPFLYTLSAILGKQSINPDLNETSRVAIGQEIGMNLIKFGRYFCADPTIIGYSRIREQKRLRSQDKLVLTAMLTKYLDSLHSCDLTIGSLNVDNVFVKFLSRKNVLSCRINLEPVPSRKETDAANDMLRLARVIDFMMGKDKTSHAL